MIISTLIGALSALILYFLLALPLRNIKNLKGIPSPKAVPIIGNAIEMWSIQSAFNTILDKWTTTYGRRLCVWGSFWFPLVILGNAKDAKKVLQSREHVQKGLFYKAFDYVIGTGTFNSPVPIWKQRRPHLEKAFHSKVLNKCPKVFDDCGRTLIGILKREVGDGRAFDIYPYINYCSMQMLIEGGLEVKVDILNDRDNPIWNKLIDVYNRGTYLAEYRMLRPWLLISNFLWHLTPYAKEIEDKFDWARDNVCQNILNARREIRNQIKQDNNKVAEKEDAIGKSGKVHQGFLDLLLELQKTNKELKLTEVDLLYEITSLYIAGHDATGKSISFTILYLGFYPEFQQKVIDELDEIFGDDQNRPITEDDLGRMKYLECCIKESLRLMPPVSIITRKVGSDVHLDEKAIIPKGTEVAILTYLVHRDESIYPNPEEFQPDRFNSENSVGRDPYAWIPFSAGPRNCLGPKFAMMEIKVVLANLFRHFRVESVGSKDNWILHTNVTLKLEGGWNVKLIPRDLK